MSGNTRYTLLTLVKGLAALEALETVDGGLTLHRVGAPPRGICSSG